MAGTERFYPRTMVRPPLGLLILSRVLREAGYRTRVFDLSARKMSPASLGEAARRERPLAVGFYANCLTPRWTTAYMRAVLESAPGAPVVVGGPGGDSYQQWLDVGAAAVHRGEGERAIVPIVRYLQGEEDPAEIPGLVYRDPAGQVRVNPVGPVIEDLDSVPLPDWDAVKIADYHDRAFLLARRPYFTSMTSRGCPYRCAFCYQGVHSRHTYRSRSVGRVLEELEILVGRYGVRHVAFQDDVFGLEPGWVESFCEQIQRRGLRLGWNAIVHPMTFRGRHGELFALMKAAGLNTISVGVQSSSPEVLERIHRSPREPEHVAAALEAAHELGIMSAIEYIYGLPGDTVATLRENTRVAASSLATVVNFHDLTIYPGIPLSGMSAEERGELLPGPVVKRELLRAYLAFYANPAALGRIAHFAGLGAARRIAGRFLSS